MATIEYGVKPDIFKITHLGPVEVSRNRVGHRVDVEKISGQLSAAPKAEPITSQNVQRCPQLSSVRRRLGSVH